MSGPNRKKDDKTTPFKKGGAADHSAATAAADTKQIGPPVFGVGPIVEFHPTFDSAGRIIQLGTLGIVPMGDEWTIAHLQRGSDEDRVHFLNRNSKLNFFRWVGDADANGQHPLTILPTSSNRATFCYDNRVSIYDAGTKEFKNYSQPSSIAARLQTEKLSNYVISSDRKHLAYLGWRYGNPLDVYALDLNPGEKMGQGECVFSLRVANRKDRIVNLIFFSDRHIMVSCWNSQSKCNVRVIDITTKKITEYFLPDQDYNICIQRSNFKNTCSNDGRYLMYVNEENDSVVVHDLTQHTDPDNDSSALCSKRFKFTEDQQRFPFRLLFDVHLGFIFAKPGIGVWCLTPETQQFQQITSHYNSNSQIAIRNGHVEVYDIDDTKNVLRMTPYYNIRSLANELTTVLGDAPNFSKELIKLVTDYSASYAPSMFRPAIQTRAIENSVIKYFQLQLEENSGNKQLAMDKTKEKYRLPNVVEDDEIEEIINSFLQAGDNKDSPHATAVDPPKQNKK